MYWVLFSIDNLHDAVETAKRFLIKEKIDRQMTGQSSTPFMKMTDKKRKSVTFDTKDILEKTNENMERMTMLMDKMYIKLEQKDVPYKPQIYQRGRGQNRRQFSRGITGEGIGLSVEITMKVIEDMDMVEVILGKEIFEEEVTFKVDIIIIEWIDIGKIGEYGDNPGQEKEIEIDKIGHLLVLDQDQGLVQIEIGLDVLDVESMTTLPMNVLIWFLTI